MKKKSIVLLFTISILIVVAGIIIILNVDNKQVIATPLEYDYFKNIPAKPNDFDIIQRDLKVGRYYDLCTLDESYYKQPELYPDYDKFHKIFYTNHNYDQTILHGYGAYPGERGIVVRNLKQGESIITCTFFITSYGVESWQAIKLIPIGHKFFDVKINYDNLLLEPTFPYYSNNWALNIQLNITAKEDVPLGNYTLGFKSIRPDDDFAKDKYYEVINRGFDGIDKTYIQNCVENKKNQSRTFDYNDKELKDICEEYYIMRQNLFIVGGDFTNAEPFKYHIIVV